MPTNLNLNILNNPGKSAILVGAGISIDAPSNLLSGLAFLRGVFRHIGTTPPTLKKLLSYIDPNASLDEPRLRFEKVMSLLQQHADKRLNILNCLADCCSYNLNHAILAGLLQQNEIVITTNLDVLIERALLFEFGENPKVVLDEDDCSSYLTNEQKNTVFKVHGSLLRYSNGSWTDCRHSLRATLERVGMSGEAFELEQGMRQILTGIIHNRDLVVLGYSGSDDFDIIPLLRSVKSQHCLIWVNHVSDRNALSVYTIKDVFSSETPNINHHCLNILNGLRKTGSWKEDRMFLAEANTNYFLSRVANFRKIAANASPEAFNFDVEEYFNHWATEHLASRCIRELLCGSLFFATSHYKEAVFHYNTCLNESFFSDVKQRETVYYSLAMTYAVMGQYEPAEEYLRKIIDLIGPSDSHLRLTALVGLGKLSLYQGNYDIAKAYLDEVMKRGNSPSCHPNDLAEGFHYLGRVYQAKGKLAKAEKMLRAGADIFSRIGHVQGYSLSLHQLGVIAQDQNDYTKAKSYYERSLSLRERLGDKLGIAGTLHQLGWVELHTGNMRGAISLITRSLELEKEINHLHGVSDSLEVLGFIHMKLGKLRKARTFYQKSLEIDLKLNRQVEAGQTMENLKYIGECLGE